VTTDQIPELYPGVPGVPRTETVVYGTGDRRPFIPPLPDLDLPSRELHDAMLTCAANALRYVADLRTLSLSEPHVRELCRTLERLDLHDAEAVAELRVVERQLEMTQVMADAARRTASEAESLRVAALADVEQQRALNIALSAENRALRLASGEIPMFDTVSRDRVDPPSRMRRAYGADLDWDTSDLDTVVIDMDHGGES
jgi:hypothetical protein